MDCNENGVPDECDIASENSTDFNSNHIPDEGEGYGEYMMIGGGAGKSGVSEIVAIVKGYQRHTATANNLDSALKDVVKQAGFQLAE
jgi:hypothetical protein